MAIKKFKKPSGYIVIYDSKVHSKEYLKKLEANLEPVVDKKPVKAKNKK